MELLERNKLLLDSVPASELFHALAYEDLGEGRQQPVFYLDDNYVGFAFESIPAPGADGQTVKRLAQLYQSPWPKGTIISISLFGSPDIYGHTRTFSQFHQTDNEVLRESVRLRSEYFNNASGKYIDRRSQMKLRNYQLIISVKVPCETVPPAKDFYDDLWDYIELTRNTLDAMGLGTVAVGPERLCQLMQSILNWESDAYWRHDGDNRYYDPDRFIRDSFVDPGNRIYRPGPSELVLGETHVGIMSVKEYPSVWCMNDMVKMLGDALDGSDVGLKNNFLMTLNVIIPDVEKEKMAMEGKRQKNNYSALGPMQKWVPKYLDIKNDFDTLFTELDEGDSLVKMCLSVALFANSKQEIDGACSAAQSYWNGFDFRFLRERFLPLPVFLNALPLNTEYAVYKELWRYRTMSAREAAQFAPILSEWCGGSRPALMLHSRLGQPMFLDLFETQTSNSAVICAESGSGKSFLTNYLVDNYASFSDEVSGGAYTWIIDIGYSYKRTCDRLGGAYIDFDDEALCVNPFEFVDDYKRCSDMLVGIISVMAAPTEGLSDLQVSALREHLQEVFEEKGQRTNIDDVAERLKRDEDPEVAKVGRQLFAFTTKGEFGSFFNGRTNVDLQGAKLTILELQGLKSRPLLQRAVLYMIMYVITQAVNSLPKSVRKILILDEAWDLLSASAEVAKFMEGMYRTIRKKGGAAIVISQSIADLYLTPSGKAIAENSPNMFLLGQTEASVMRAKRDAHIAIDEFGWNLMTSVKTQKGIYSEMFIVKGREYGVARLAVDRASQLLYTTDPQEADLLDQLKASGLSLQDAIDTYVDYERHGKLSQLRKVVAEGRAHAA